MPDCKACKDNKVADVPYIVHESAMAHKQAALQRNDPQNSKLTKAKEGPEKSGPFFFLQKLFIIFSKKVLTFVFGCGIL